MFVGCVGFSRRASCRSSYGCVTHTACALPREGVGDAAALQLPAPPAPTEHDATAAAPRARGARHVASIRAASFASTRASLGRCPSAGRASSSRGRPARAPSIPDLRRARSGRGEGSRGGGAKESISGLSGGWKMKLALCRAILQNADIRGVGRLENADSNDSSNHTNVYACQRDTGSAKPRPPTRPSSTHLSICQVFDIPGRHV